MATKGVFGYKIKDVDYLMHVQFDGYMLRDMCIREIYILLKDYKTVEALRNAFENLIVIHDENYVISNYVDTYVSYGCSSDWYVMLRRCQHSYINVLESGYFLNNANNDYNYKFILDFDSETVDYKISEEHKNMSIE